jgi:hypothetical protein
VRCEEILEAGEGLDAAAAGDGLVLAGVPNFKSENILVASSTVSSSDEESENIDSFSVAFVGVDIVIGRNRLGSTLCLESKLL